MGCSPGERQVEQGSSCSSTVPLCTAQDMSLKCNPLPAEALTPADSPALPPAQQHGALHYDLPHGDCLTAADSVPTEQLCPVAVW